MLGSERNFHLVHFAQGVAEVIDLAKEQVDLANNLQMTAWIVSMKKDLFFSIIGKVWGSKGPPEYCVFSCWQERMVALTREQSKSSESSFCVKRKRRNDSLHLELYCLGLVSSKEVCYHELLFVQRNVLWK